MRMLRVIPLLATLASPVLAQGGPSLLITPAQLNAEMRDTRLVVLYVGTREDYSAGHIAGARFIGMEDVALDPRLTIGNHVGVKASPDTVVVDRKGEIGARLVGESAVTNLPRILDDLLRSDG